MTSVAGLKKRKAAGAIPPLLFAGRTVVTDMDASGAGVLEERLPSGEAIEVIVPGAIPGDVIELSWRAPLPGGRRGLAESFRLLEASPEAARRCPLAGECGGCPAARLDYAAELRIKTRTLVERPLAEAGLLREGVLLPAVGQPEGCARGFRNKAILYPGILAGEPRFGYYRARSQALVGAEDCPQTPAWMGETARALAPLLLRPDCAPWREATDEGALRALLLREAPGTGERLAAVVMRRLPGDPDAREGLLEAIREALAGARLTSLLLNLNEAPGSAVLSFAPGAARRIAGRDGVEAQLMGLAFTLDAQTFLQVNTPQTPVLYGRALDALELSPEDRVLDLYCGVGTLTLLAARRSAGALGVERVEQSIACARENARRNGLGSAAFIAAPVEKALSEPLPEGFRPTKIMVDPAYQGLAGGATRAVARLARREGVRRLAYVSCNPRSFARDAAALECEGLRLLSVTPVDMFPGALHFECVGVFEGRFDDGR